MRLVFWGVVIRLAAHEAEMDLITIYKSLLIETSRLIFGPKLNYLTLQFLTGPPRILTCRLNGTPAKKT